MPSPFPGMDPYLEAPGLWPDVHHELLSVIRRDLNEKLRPRYVVRIEERVYVSSESDPGREVIAPDLHIVSGATYDRGGGAGIATVEPLEVTTVLDEEIHEARLEIVDSQGGSVVTVIEILSPTNKMPGAAGRESYLKKRREVLHSPTHLVEIDLLRRGRRTIPIGDLPPCEYVVHVSERDRRPRGKVWPIRLPQPLPSITIPLSGPGASVTLDLQATLSLAYENAGYDLTIDYTVDPPAPTLNEADAAWLNALLQAAGRR